MKRRDTYQALATKSLAELTAHIVKLRLAVDTGRIDAAFGRAKQPHALKSVKHELAQALTRLNQLTMESPSTSSGQSPKEIA